MLLLLTNMFEVVCSLHCTVCRLKLPEDADVDCISARVEAGVLYLSIRRSEESKPVDVPIY